MRSTHGWSEVSNERKREIIDAIVSGSATAGPVHAELDLTDRCNVACYFCCSMDVRTKESVALPQATRIIDQLVAGGLKSVRLAGGGDPLVHREIVAILDHLAARNILVDNVTTNGLGMTAAVAERFVRDRAREIVISLNAVDAPDYARMMQVRGDIFDKVLANVRHLVAIRGESSRPSLTIQFLLDRKNVTRVVEMYELARSLGADRIAINAVLEIPHERIDRDILLTRDEVAIASPHFRKLLELDRDAGLLIMDARGEGWAEMIAQHRAELGIAPPNDFPVAPAFRPENGQCFFAWYTTTVSGTGDMYPCCLLQAADYKPLGNLLKGSVEEQWNGPGYTQIRDEMRDVMLTGGEIRYRESKFKTLRRPCVEKNQCWLKVMYFCADEQFYRDLGDALDVARKREVRWTGTNAQRKRAAEVLGFRAYDALRRVVRRLRRS